MNRLAKALFQDRYLWLLAVPAVVYYILFHYLPMYGLLIAFKDFSPFLGILRSPWVGFVWFEQFFTSIHFVRTVRNTLLLNFYGFFFNFTVPIIFALLLNEVHNSLFRRWVQTISYIPHFVSIVVVVGLINAMFNTENGLVNTVMARLGMETVPFLILPGWFRPLYIGSDIWQHFGWRAIIYLAALTAIDQEQYDAAWVDGANRWQQLRFITLPGIAPTIIILMILYVGQMMSVGFEKILLMYGPGTYETADVISTFVYRRGIAGGDYSFAA
ncbi:MAG: ABC transporter permease subunit, partial [Spirochaetaceae bacterium]|nr:ABC transporter permease subunit [Spirochaetaceae bacterium]